MPSSIKTIKRYSLDKDKRRQNVDNEAHDGNQIRCQPEGNLTDQPAPPGLQKRIQQTHVGAGILVVAELFQLPRLQQFLFVEIHRFLLPPLNRPCTISSS